MGRAALLAIALTVSATANAEDLFARTSASEQRSFSLQLDNDLFSGAHRDKDYSWGVSAIFDSETARRLASPLDRVRQRIYGWLTPGDSQRPGWEPNDRGVQIGLLAMTPRTLKSTEPLYDDRPYASLLFVSTAEVHVLHDNPMRARFSSFTVGALGLDLAPKLHDFIHQVVADEPPLGWNHQISNGGELTARYVQAEQWLLTPAENVSRPEIKLTLAGSVGYLTEASAGLSARWGRIQSSWWTFNPELNDYTGPPIAPELPRGEGLSEMYLFAGMRVRARAYNALLQGQFRDSEVRVSSGDLARLPAEAWAGIATTWSDLRVAYTIRYASREITREPGARSLIWASINFEKTF